MDPDNAYQEEQVSNTEEETVEKDSETEDAISSQKIANEQISDIEYMKKLMKGDGERKPREKMKKKVKEKIKLHTVKVGPSKYICIFCVTYLYF